MRLIAFILHLLLPLHVFALLDTFGITQMYPSKSGSRAWVSTHWNNTPSRSIKYSDDDFDPTGWTEDHSSASDGFRIDGKGTMTMSGDGPRFHINSLDTAKDVSQFFRDIEFTAYYMRQGTTGKNWGGMVVGLRSGSLGHASSGGNDCDATTYYARFRNDGKWDFEKELKHPGSTYWSGSGYSTQDALWNGKPLPVNRWIGMKFIAFNIENDSKVKLDLYIDSVSNGNPANGGAWQKVGTVIDSGSWPSGDVSGCTYTQNSIILKGNGTILMRTDGDTAVYKSVSVREVDIAPTTGILPPRVQDIKKYQAMSIAHPYAIIATSAKQVTRVYTLDGRCISTLIPGSNSAAVLRRSAGIYLIKKDIVPSYPQSIRQ